MKLGMQLGLGPGHIVLDGDPAPPSTKGAKPPNFGPYAVAKRLHRLRCHLVCRHGWSIYKKCRQSAKRVISSAKEKKQKECANDLNDAEHPNEIFRMAKQMVKERQDITGSNSLKRVSGKVIVDEKGIKDFWKEYMEKLMNEENEWDHGISAEVKERPADRIRIGEVAAALKKDEEA